MTFISNRTKFEEAIWPEKPIDMVRILLFEAS